MCDGAWWEYLILFLVITPLLGLLWYAVLFLWVMQLWSSLANHPTTQESSEDESRRRAGRPRSGTR